MWNQAQAALQKISPMQMSMKQPQQQAFYMAAQEPLKLYEQQLQPPSQPQLANMDKKIKYPNLKMPDFFWEPSYRMGDSLAVMTDRMKRVCPEQDPATGPRGPPFEVSCFHGGWGGQEVVPSCCWSQSLVSSEWYAPLAYGSSDTDRQFVLNTEYRTKGNYGGA